MLKKFPNLEQSVFENLSTALLIINPTGVVVSANPAAEMLTGISLRRLVNQSVFELFSGSDDFLTAIDDAISNDFNYSKREVDLAIPSSLRSLKIDCSFVPINESNLVLIEIHDVDRQVGI